MNRNQQLNANPSSSQCPLCGSENPTLIETVQYEDIRYVYRKLLRIELSPERVNEVRLLRCQSCDLLFFSPGVTGDPAFYEQLQKFPWYYLEDKPEYRIASKLISDHTSVLEVGCGAGAFANHLPPGCTYRGLEYNSEAIRKARLRGLKIDNMSVESLAKSPSERFDVVCSFQVLEHVPSPGEFLSAAAALLHPGGVLIIAVPAEDSFMANEVNNVLNGPPHHITRWTDAALQNIARVTDLKLLHLEHEPINDLHIPSFATARLWKFARHNLRMNIPAVSPLASNIFVRAALRAASIPLERRARKHRKTIAGHSVVAAYGKISL